MSFCTPRGRLDLRTLIVYSERFFHFLAGKGRKCTQKLVSVYFQVLERAEVIAPYGSTCTPQTSRSVSKVLSE